MAQYTNPKKKKNNDIAPIRSDVGLFQRADNWNDVDNFWEGVGAFGETTLASAADLGVNVAKGAGRLVEGVTDLFGHGIAGLADLLGFDEWSDEFRGYVNESWVDNLASPADEFLDEYSIFGQTGDAIGEGIGQVAAVIVTGGALGAAGLGTAGISAATTGIMGASSMGSGMSEAYNAGATDKEALFYGIMKGAIDAGSELLFGGLGKTVNALGISRGLSSLDDIVAKKLSSGISNQFFKNVVQWGVKSSAEGLEEVLAGIGTIAAKKLTYMSDEELGKLIKDENLFQQFIVGAVSAGVTQSGLIPGMKKGSLVETTKKGQDFVSGLTASEQKVADKLFNDLVKQKEADGKKLSGFEKNKIFDSIVEQMESGDIDVETIEDILKEDVYNDNKAKLDEEGALFKEYEELGKKKASNISLAEETRYKELHDKTKELTFRKDLDSRMSEEVYNRVKGSRLESSYFDAARRGDAFQADINEYDEAERETIQSAIDAGFLNNTNKTRRFVNWIAKIAARTGIKVDFTTNEKLKQSGFAIDGKTINGYKTKDGIGINMQSKKVLETVVGHEITHVFEGTELYKEMQKAVYAYAEAKGELSSRREAISKLYNGVTKDIDSELTAELVSEYLFTDQEFINRLANDNRNLFQKMWDEVKYMWSQAHPSSPEAQKLEQLKRVFEETYKQSKGVKNNDTKLSLSSIATTFFNNEYMTAKDFENSNYKNTEGYKSYVDQCVNNMRQTRTDFDEATARKEVEDSIDGIVRVALAAKKAGYDIIDDSRKRNTRDSKNRLLFSSLEPNSDYFTSNDISTECDKRKNFAQIYDAIVAKEEAMGVPENKRFFKNIDNYFYIHKVLADKGLTQPCRECYVESMRKNLAPMADAFLRLIRETNPDNTANNQLYDSKGKLKSNNAATREWVLNKLAEYGMTASDLTIETLSTEKGLAQLKIQAPMIYEAFNSFYGQSKPKMPKSATPFRFGELTALLTDNNGKINQNLVKKINHTGGFRLQSYSDFQIQNYTDVLQVIFEAGTLGLNGHAYTKVPAFLDATEGTNLKRNISIFMYKDGNDWKIDRNDSFPYTLEEIYDIVNADETGNTSIIAVSQNNEMSAWIMANDMVGYGIPFHKSGLKMGTVRDTDVKTEDGRTVKGYAGTKDHTKQQTEVWAKTTAEHKAMTKVKKGIDIYSFWDFKNADGLSKNELIQKNLEAYIDRCEEAGYIPKFRDYVMNNGKVLEDILRFSKDMGYVSQDATIDDISFKYKGYTIPYGYYKFLGDFGMFKPNGEASPQEVLSLKNYDFDKATEFFKDSETIRRNEILQQFANGEEREYYRNSDLDAGQLEDVVRSKREEVVDEIIAKKQGVQFSVSADSETTPRDVYFGRIDEVYDKLKGKAAGKSHSVDGYNFFLQKNDFDESAYISITTPEGEKLRHIVDGGNQWKNARLWREAAKMVSNHENPNVATATTQEEAGEYSEIEGKREETKKTFKEKVGDTKTLGRKAVGYLVDKYQPIENLALKTGNRELDAKANTMRTSERAAQHFIGHGADGVRAINDLRQEVEASGLENEFEEYMYDLLTTDRMSLEERAKPIIKKLGDKFKNMKLYQIKALAKKEITKKTTETSAQYIRDAREYLRAISARNKPVRGDFYTADIARAHATELEQKYPQFKQWAEDVYANTNFMLDKLVADGELSQEAADRFRELYPHYVPIRRVNREGKAIDVPLYSNRTGVDAPIKGATGGDGTIGYLFETLAMRSEQTFLAGAKNRFGIELKDTLKAKTTDAEVDVEDIFDEVDTHEDRLKAGEDGQAPTFTVFENGKRVTFEIPEDIYDALKPTPEALKGTIPVFSAISKWQRNVLTEYSPSFIARNPVKDSQDVLINSQHPLETYKNFPEAMRQLYAYEHGGEDAQYAKEYFSNGGESLTYFDGKEKLFDSKNTKNPWAKEDTATWKKVIGFVPAKISQASSFVERVPRLAEYIASRKAGASIDVAMLDAARVTTNFAAGGDVTKWANRNGATFLNASVQGAAQAVRNIREAKAQGLKGMLKLGAKVAIAGIPYLIVNALLWGDDDEYEELSDYIKENYYIVAKYGDGQFVRIPKGRMAAVIQSAFQQMSNLVTGNDEVDFERFGELLVENIAPNNPLENNIFAPIMNVAENKTWYGDDLVPQRLQDLPAGEQSDETTDAISKWLGETINVSPYKLNYLIDQYSGVFGDVLLPYATPQAEGGNSSILGGAIAPLADQFTTDSTMKNQNVSDFYDTLDDLTASAKSKHATDGDVLRYKYMNAVNSDISALYKKKREIQNSSIGNSVKYERVREVQRQIDELAKQALATYNGISVRGNTATVGGYQFKKNKKGEWEKVRESSSSSNWSNDLFDWMSGFSNNFDIPDFNLD